MGLTTGQADSVELALGAASGVTALRAGTRSLEQAAKRALLRHSLRPFDPTQALEVTSEGRSIWAQVNIYERGKDWERFDVARTGYHWTPKAKAFDQISPDGRIAVSNKTLDLQREVYLRQDRKALYSTIRYYIRQAASHLPRHPRTGRVLMLSERRLHLLLRFADSVPAQALQIAAAEQYAKEMGVILKVEYAF